MKSDLYVGLMEVNLIFNSFWAKFCLSAKFQPLSADFLFSHEYCEHFVPIEIRYILSSNWKMAQL